MNIDAHQHFWRLARGDYHWMGTSNDLAPIRRDFIPADYHALRNEHDIAATVLVQAAASIEETEYMLGLADGTDWIAKVVGWIDFENGAHRRHLERLARHPKFAGVRPMIQDIPDPEWMHRPEVQWAYSAIVDLDLTFDALGHPRHLPAFLRLFDRYPTMRIVIDHGMKPAIRDRAFDGWAAKMGEIAQSTTAFCKLSGLVTEAEAHWPEAALKPYVDHVLDVFGTTRLMWGSDWPVVNLAGGFARWHAAAHALVPEAARADVFGATAARFYRIKEVDRA